MSNSTTHLNTPSDLLDSPNRGNFTNRETPGFDHIPYLHELLPKYRGMPGFVYAQVCTQTHRRAQEEGWKPLSDGVVYTIRGPLGSADMILLARGKAIPGQSPDAGARLCGVDRLVEELTGHRIPQLGGTPEEPKVTLEESTNADQHKEPGTSTGSSSVHPSLRTEDSKKPGRPKNS